MKLSDIKYLGDDEGWRGLGFRLASFLAFYLAIATAPRTYPWLVIFFSWREVVIDEKRHEFVMLVANVLFAIMVILSLVSAIRVLRRRKGDKGATH